MKKNKNKIVLLFLTFISFFILAFAAVDSAQADELILQIPIGQTGKLTVSGDMLGNYIKALFVFSSIVIVALSIVMVIVGGIQWIVFSDTPGKISQAKETIFKAFLGLFIALFSIMILQTVNPGAVYFEPLSIDPLKEVICCEINGNLKEIESEEACTTAGGTKKSLTECWNDKLKGIDEPCESSEECKNELFCVATGATCQPRLAENINCLGVEIHDVRDRACASNSCGGWLSAILPFGCNGGECCGENKVQGGNPPNSVCQGQTCTAGYFCSKTSSTSGRCLAKGADGSPCLDPPDALGGSPADECVSNWCNPVSGKCEQEIINPYNPY